MKNPKPVIAAASPDWEARQKHAAFYQQQINAIQQGAIAAQAGWATLVLTFGLAMSKLPDVPPKDVSLLIFICAVSWLAVAMMLHLHYRRRAERVQSAYLNEQGVLFPAAPAYRLESHLLDDRRIPAVRWTPSTASEK